MIPYIENNKEGLIKEGDLFFKCKENGRGSYMYKKLILNEKHRYRLKDGIVKYGLKETGKWWHEDDFAAKYINPHNNVIHIIKDTCWVDETYIPNMGWKQGFEAVMARNNLLFQNKLNEVFCLTGEIEDIELQDHKQIKGSWKKLLSAKEKNLMFFIEGTDSNESYTEGGFDGPSNGNLMFVSKSDFEATIRDEYEKDFEDFNNDDFNSYYAYITKR